MKALLIHPLSQSGLWENEIVSHEPPLGICYIAAVLEKSGHDVRLMERRRIIGRKKRSPENMAELDRETIRLIAAFAPDVVGITATTPLISDACKVAAMVKGINPAVRVMAGGCHPTAEPERTLRDAPGMDAVCIGEGEFAFLEFTEGKPLKDIKGIAYMEGGKAVFTEKRPFFQELDDLPFPARHLLERGHYFSPQSTTIRGNRLVGTTFLTARGCPHKCTFCQSGYLARSGAGKYTRFHSPEYVVQQIKALVKDFGVQGLLFAEDIFSLRKENVFQVCELLIKEGLQGRLKWAANLRVAAAEPELLSLMKRAGCVQVIYGCESGSQDTLERLKKKTTVEQNYRAVEVTKASGLSCEVNVMVGLPGETEEDILKTIGFLRRAKPDRIVKGKLYPLPGTPIYGELKASGVIAEPSNWDDLWERHVRSDFTFASVSPERFNRLYVKLDREAVYRRNYLSEIKNLMGKDNLRALKRTLVMLIHLSVLYLPLSVQKVVHRAVDRVKARSSLLE